MKAAATKQQAIAPGYEAMATCWNLESGIDLKGLSFKEMTVDEETGIVFATTKRTNFVEEIFLGGGEGAEGIKVVELDWIVDRALVCVTNFLLKFYSVGHGLVTP